MPDYTDHGDGLHIDGVTDNRPASCSRNISGDILVKLVIAKLKKYTVIWIVYPN